MARTISKPRLQERWQVIQEYYREDGSWMTEPYPVVYDTEDEAEACRDRISKGDPREFGGWVQPDAILSTTRCWVD